jgi:hypothetical protein
MSAVRKESADGAAPSKNPNGRTAQRFSAAQNSARRVTPLAMISSLVA